MRLAFAAMAASVALVAAAPAAHAAKVVPKRAVPGATVELRGGDVPKKGKVKVAGKRADVVSRKKSRVRFVVPKVPAGARPVTMGDAETTMRVLKRFRGKVGVKLARGDATAEKIGGSGGSITAKHGGITYELEVPAGALSDATKITMTPVKRLKNLPLTRNAPAAVQLSPNGLEFATPAKLVISGMKKPGRQVGFTMTDRGRGLEIVTADVQGKRLTIALDHFTTPGAGGPTEQDFVNIFQQFLNSTGATLTRGEIETLINELTLAEDRFPGFCERQSICGDVIDRALHSMKKLIKDECQRQQSQPTVGGISILIDLVAQYRLLGGEDEPPVPACVKHILRGLAQTATTNVRANPFGRANTEFQLNSIAVADLDGNGQMAWIEWVYYLAGQANKLGYEDIGGDLTSEFSTALQKALDDGTAQCETDTAAGRALLQKGYAIASAIDFMAEEFAQALEDCGSADLAVDVTGPATVSSSNVVVTFTVKVTNNGPDAVGYTLTLDQDNNDLQCGDDPFEGPHAEASLAPGATRTRQYTVDCVDEGSDGGQVWVDATVSGPSDPVSSNNHDRHTTTAS